MTSSRGPCILQGWAGRRRQEDQSSHRTGNDIVSDISAAVNEVITHGSLLSLEVLALLRGWVGHGQSGERQSNGGVHLV